MDRHYCKRCNKSFNYCRGCVLTPIPHKAAGFCSIECLTEFKAPKIKEVVPLEDVEVVVKNDEDTTIS